MAVAAEVEAEPSFISDCVVTKQAAEAKAFFISDRVESKQAAEAEVFFISDSVAAELCLIFLKLWKITCRLREVFVNF